MDATHTEDVRKHVRTYMIVFAALGTLTLVTVGVSYLDVPVPMAIAIAMLIAGVKGSLVAAYFMHLISERAVIYWLIILLVVFFVAIMFLPMLMQTEMAGTDYVS